MHSSSPTSTTGRATPISMMHSASASKPHTQAPTQQPPPPPPFECEVCGVRFAKAAKRDVHLLDVHRAHFGLSPRALSPSATGSVGHTVSRAVTEANLAFSDVTGSKGSAAVCTLCPNSASKFKNPRDLAQHILSKHTDDNILTESSAVSCRMVPPPAKRVKLAGSIKKSVSPPPRSSKARSKDSTVPAPSAMKPPLSPKGGASRGSSASPRARSPSDKASIAGPSNKALVSNDQSCSHASATADRLSIPMDFSAIVGFTSNAHKSYYRLAKR